MFSATKADRVIKFVSILYNSIRDADGKRLVLPDYQRRLIRRLYGVVNEDGYRRYRRCYFSIPRKNAKSTLAAALALYHLFHDDEPNPRIYIAATSLEQTKETFEILAAMCEASKTLKKRTKVLDSQNRKQVIRLENGAKVGYILTCPR